MKKNLFKKMRLFNALALTSSLTVCSVVFLNTGIIKGINEDVDIFKQQQSYLVSRSTQMEALFVDSDGLHLTNQDESVLGEDQESFYEYAYAWLLGYNSNIYGTSGLREKLMDYTYTDNNYTIQLTTNTDMQVTAYQVLEDLDSHDGSVIIMEKDTGKIKAFASRSETDLNSNDLASFFNNQQGDCFYFRGVDDTAAPGSDFKIAIAAAAYDNGIRDFDYNDTGEFVTNDNGYVIHNYAETAWGKLDLEGAFKVSANTYFANLATEIGYDGLEEMAQKLMFNQQIDLDFTSIYSNFDINGSPFDIAQSGFGQGKTTMSPLHIAMMFQCIANDGVMLKPYLIESVSDGYDTPIQGETEVLSEVFSKEACQMVQKNAHATGVSFGFDSNSFIFAKSGTAEVGDGTKSYLGAVNDKYVFLISCADIATSNDLYDSMNYLLQKYQ